MMVKSEGSRSSVACRCRGRCGSSRWRRDCARAPANRRGSPCPTGSACRERIEMADRGVDVGRLDRIAAPQMHGIEGLRRGAAGSGSRAGCPAAGRRRGRRRWARSPTEQKARWSPPMTRLRAGLRAWSVSSAARGRSCSRRGRGRSARARVPSRTSAPSRFRMARASACSTSMPISSRTVSEASWIAWSWSSETMRVGRERAGAAAAAPRRPRRRPRPLLAAAAARPLAGFGGKLHRIVLRR